MAGYQNNMRYGRPGNMYRQRGNDCGCDRQQMPEQQDRRGCAEQYMPEQHDRCGCNEPHMHEQRDRCGCNKPHMHEQRDRCGCNEPHMHEQRENCRCNDRREVNRDCGCGHHRDEFEGMSLAMAYVPWQNWCEVYDICEGFQRGTIFRELDMPFHGRGGCNR